jgi:hypothetical protein
MSLFIICGLLLVQFDKRTKDNVASAQHSLVKVYQLKNVVHKGLTKYVKTILMS